MEATCEHTSILVPPAHEGPRALLRLERLEPGDRLRREGPVLALVTIVIALSFAMPALSSRGLWLNVPCLFYKLTHVPCLACGLTRSFVCSAHGDFLNAFRMHLLGPLLFPLFCGAEVYLGAVAATGKKVRLNTTRHQRNIAAWTFFAVLVVCWVMKLVFIPGSW